MAEITAALVKELREKTGAGMMDCKKALSEMGGDVEGAVDWLRKKGLAAAAKKAGRVAAEGLVAVAGAGTKAAVVEVNAETDFVARNDKFQDFVKGVADTALVTSGGLDALKAAPFPGTDRTVEEQVTHMVATIGENMNLRRVQGLSVTKGVVATYVHSPIVAGRAMGKIGVAVALESEGDAAKLEDVGRQIAMHVAAANPLFLGRDDVDAEAIERERQVLTEQAKGSGKPDDIIAKMVEGRLRKYYEEVCLTEQVYVIDGESKVNKVVEALAKAVGKPVALTGFVRFALGEGIEKEEGDFAAEVAAVAKG
jgi:elongation factor Ts